MRVVKKPEERRAEMVEAAAKLFAQQGFVKTSVAEIVSAVDVAKGLFYYYFTAKDDMVKAVVEGYCSYMGTLADAIADGEGSGLDKLDRLMEHRVWAQCFTQPLLADLCMPQHTALYADMCDRVYAHMGPALERMAAQALRERGASDGHAGKITGVALYGILMMARTGNINMQDAGAAVRRLIAAETSAQ
jgi:AcrR family transcriptional regulator